MASGATIIGSGLHITTSGGAPGFVANLGGTVTVTGTNHTIDSRTGTALDVANTTIGASGLTFKSISADGPTNAIVLNNTGASGGLTVTGGGSTTQGGDSSGGTIQNTGGDGISLTNASSPSFNNMNIDSAAGNGVKGTGPVANFSFTNGKINNVGDASGESCLSFSTLNAVNATGSFTFTDSRCTLVEAERVHRMGLIACQYRAAEWRHKEIELAADQLLRHLDNPRA